MIRIIGRVLENQVFDGFGNDFLGVDYATPDASMLTRLTRDTWSFASAKNYQQLRDMSIALVSETGQARTFSEFEEAAKVINAKYNRSWLLTEYNQAVGSATMAARWNEFEQNADLMPYLRYSTVGDARVRDSHKQLDGITRKIDDDFWATYFPPNGWGCRCSVDQLPGSKEKESKTIPTVPVPDMFRTNLAKTGLIYPKTHPYYDGVPAGVLREAICYLPSDAAYQSVYKSKKSVELHLLHNIAEAEHNVKTAGLLADNGYSVKLLPVLDGKLNTSAIRKHIYGVGDFISGKNPDAMVEGKLVDFKNLRRSGKSAIHHAIESGQKQADWVIIHLPEKMEVVEISRFVKGKLSQSLYIDDVWVINKSGAPLKFNRKGFGLPEKAKRPTGINQ